MSKFFIGQRTNQMARDLARGRGMLRVAWDSSGHVLECFDRKVRREGDRLAVSAQAPVDSQPCSQRRYSVGGFLFWAPRTG